MRPKEGESDAVTTKASSKSSKRSLIDSGEPSVIEKLKLHKTAADKVPKAVVIQEKNEEEEKEKTASLDYDVVITSSERIIALKSVSEYMQKKTLTKLSRNDLEQICLMKMCEAICHKSEIGELRHQLGVQEQRIEMWRKQVAQLTKQAEDLEIENKRVLHDVELHNESYKPFMPVKIARSVGLQVRSHNNVIRNTILTRKRKMKRLQPTNTIAPAKRRRYVQNRTKTRIKNTANKGTTTTTHRDTATPTKVTATHFELL